MGQVLLHPSDQIATIDVSTSLTVGTFTDDNFVSGEWSGLVNWGDGNADEYSITSQGVQTRSHKYVIAGVKHCKFTVTRPLQTLEIYFNVTVPAPAPPADITLNLDFTYGPRGAAGTDPAGSPAPGSFPVGGVVAYRYLNSDRVNFAGFTTTDSNGRASLTLPSGSRLASFALTLGGNTYSFSDGIPSLPLQGLTANTTIPFRIWPRDGGGVISVPHFFSVVDADNNPISGATVWVGDRNGAEAKLNSNAYGSYATTDDNGACERYTAYVGNLEAFQGYAIATGHGLNKVMLGDQGIVTNEIVLPTLPAATSGADHVVAVVVRQRDLASEAQGIVWLTTTLSSTVVAGPVSTNRRGRAVLFCNKNTTYRMYFRNGTHTVDGDYHQFTTRDESGGYTLEFLDVLQSEELANTGDYTVTIDIDSVVKERRADVLASDFVAYLTSDADGLVRETEIIGGDMLRRLDDAEVFGGASFSWQGLANGTYYAWINHPLFVPITGEQIVVNGSNVTNSTSMHPFCHSHIDGNRVANSPLPGTSESVFFFECHTVSQFGSRLGRWWGQTGIHLASATAGERRVIQFVPTVLRRLPTEQEQQFEMMVDLFDRQFYTYRRGQGAQLIPLVPRRFRPLIGVREFAIPLMKPVTTPINNNEPEGLGFRVRDVRRGLAAEGQPGGGDWDVGIPR